MRKVTINGKDYTLRVDMGVLEQAEEKYGDMMKALAGGKTAEITDVMVMAINAAARHEGRESRVNREDFRDMTMLGFRALSAALNGAVEDSMKTECDSEIKDTPKDAYLEELEKND